MRSRIAVFAAVAALVVVSAVVTAREGDIGITTEVSALLAFLLGFLCVSGHVTLAAGLAVASGGVLALKQWLHGLARRIESADVEATLKFAIVTVIILPLVPNETYGPAPLDVINPYKIWWMVVLISGLNFASYILVKVVGAEHGIGLTGLLGGLVSSTAVTLGFAQRSRSQPGQAPALALGILLAWTVMFFRVVLLVAVIAPALARALAPGRRRARRAVARDRPRAAPPAALGRARERRQPGANPFELGAGDPLRSAVRRGDLRRPRRRRSSFGDAGLYLAGALAGLTDVDAIALSMAQLAQSEPASRVAAARTILIAVLANTLVKGGMAVFMGAPALRRVMLPFIGALLAAGAAVAWWL